MHKLLSTPLDYVLYRGQLWTDVSICCGIFCAEAICLLQITGCMGIWIPMTVGWDCIIHTTSPTSNCISHRHSDFEYPSGLQWMAITGSLFHPISKRRRWLISWVGWNCHAGVSGILGADFGLALFWRNSFFLGAAAEQWFFSCSCSVTLSAWAQELVDLEVWYLTEFSVLICLYIGLLVTDSAFHCLGGCVHCAKARAIWNSL